MDIRGRSFLSRTGTFFIPCMYISTDILLPTSPDGVKIKDGWFPNPIVISLPTEKNSLCHAEKKVVIVFGDPDIVILLNVKPCVQT